MEKLTDTYTLQGGVQIPCVGFGTWQVPDGETAVRSGGAGGRGGAPAYRHRRHLRKRGGRWRSDPACGVAREELFITTKLWNTERGYERTLAAFDLSLKKLGLDYLDLYSSTGPRTGRAAA